MAAFLELLQMSVISILTVPMNPFFWLVIYIVYIQYKRVHDMELQVLGEACETRGQRIKNSILMGCLGGIIGTVVIMVLGITIDTSDFVYIFPLAIFLMLINIRYICFSYAGGLLALSNLLFGIPKINVSSILAIIAILHMVESILIRIDGHRNALPIFVKDKYKRIVGGFYSQRFWPIPFTILIASMGPLAGSRDIDLPNWWPIFTSNTLNIENIALQIFAVVAILGYGDFSLTSTPKEKCHRTSTRLFAYSIILLGLSALSTRFVVFKYIAALFAPLAHEILILYGQREENSNKPIFTQSSRGVRVLDVLKDSVGWKMGLKQGDILLYLNGRKVNNREDIQNQLKDFPSYTWIEVVDLEGKSRTLDYKDYRNGINNLGIIIISEDSDVIFDPKNSVSFIKNIIVKISEKYLKHKRQ